MLAKHKNLRHYQSYQSEFERYLAGNEPQESIAQETISDNQNVRKESEQVQENVPKIIGHVKLGESYTSLKDLNKEIFAQHKP